MTALYSLVTVSGTSIALDETNHVVLEQAHGVGMPPIDNQSIDYAILDGASWQRAKTQARVVMLQLTAIGTSVSGTTGLHKIRAQLLNAVNPHRLDADTMRLVYAGNTEGTRHLNCRYEAGLEGGDWRGHTESMTLRLLATDPFWYSAQSTSHTAAPRAQWPRFYHVAAGKDGVWSTMHGGLTPAQVYALASKPGGGVYAGGDFSTAGATAAHRVAMWDGDKWADVGGGIKRDINPHTVQALAVTPGGDVYIGGLFTTAGDTTSYNIARWDGTKWNTLNGGVSKNKGVRALAITKTGTVYAGGLFNTAGNTAARCIAEWNGSRWSALGSGIKGSVSSVAIGDNDRVYVGGAFHTAGNTTAHRIAMWSGSRWSDVGGGMGVSGSNGIYAMAYDQNAGLLYAAGAITTAGGISMTNIACWNGQHWSSLGGGLNSLVQSLRILSNGWLLATGYFNRAGGGIRGVRANGAAIWNGFNWTPVSMSGWMNINASAEDEKDGSLYFGGYRSTSTLTSSALTSIINTGSANSYPIISVTIPTTGSISTELVQIRNETTNQALYFNYDLRKGETLTIDCTPGAKRVTSSFYGNIVGDNPLPGSQLATFCLAPGENKISTFMSSGDAIITITHTPTYWSVD